jgi:hypothetical protein
MSLLTLFHNQGKGTPVGGGDSYISKILGMERNDLIGYWPMNEKLGTISDNAQGISARDGVYSSDVSGWPVTTGIGDGNTAPTFSGDDAVDVGTASIYSDINGDVGTLFCWVSMANVGVWTDGITRHLVGIAEQADDEWIRCYKQSGNNNFTFEYKAGGTLETITVGGQNWINWRTVAITWSSALDEVKGYFNGIQAGSTQLGLGSWSGTLDFFTIGDFRAGWGTPHNGRLAHVAIWTKALSAAQLVTLSSV